MNLSEKLAAADGGDPPVEESQTPARAPRSSGTIPKEAPKRRNTDRTSADQAWSQSKAVVQAKVLAEIAPTAADLAPDELRAKVRSTVNEILEREDIGISPIERQRFVEEMLEDSLGFGPLEALLADGSITEIMCNRFDEIWIERQGQINRSNVVFNSPHAVPAHHRPDGARGRSACR